MASTSKFTRVAIIMAGGAGERFWPLSRRERPKQLLALTHPTRSMLEEAARLVEPVIPPDRVYVVTSRELVDLIRKGQSVIPPENVLCEPARRNTSGCLVFAAAHFMARMDVAPESIVMAVVTADHRIGDAKAYRATIRTALAMAEQHATLGVVGIAPTRPETGYGYIEIPVGAKPLAGSADGLPTYPVIRFREKPSREQAERLIETGRCFWNSGMFFWRLSTFLSEAERASPDLAWPTRELADAMRRGDERHVQTIFESMEDQPIDIALLERAQRVVMTRSSFPWDDVGSWDALHRAHPCDEKGNVAIGGPVLLDAEDCLVYNEAGAEQMAVAVIGVEGLVVVATRDGVLVVPRERAQDVKRAVGMLHERGAKQL
ncbi:MAG: sugar phosphate nucleotidyltransferase [Candidatus Sumerlaeota bacterium]|nr:sugar phosphate nucleotidyltransferase [Candidatus Sumerlaeota bacterium]